MFFPILVLLLPLLVALEGTAEIFLLAYDRESKQIALDNAAIRLGQGDSKVMNQLIEGNRALQSLELMHHPFHTCAKIPGPTQPGCQASDESLELAIQQLQTSIGKGTELLWRLNRIAAWAATGKWRDQVQLQSMNSVPIEAIRCPLCRLESGWKLQVLPSELVSRWSVLGVSLQTYVKLEGESISPGGASWTYSLRTNRPR